VKDGEVLQGPLAFTDSSYAKSYIHFKNLPKIISEIEELKKEILNLKTNTNG
jgi:UDP-3-O-[3-hydroxymyristoyl] glucosamine N-acyltransferase